MNFPIEVVKSIDYNFQFYHEKSLSNIINLSQRNYSHINIYRRIHTQMLSIHKYQVHDVTRVMGYEKERKGIELRV